MTEYTDQFQIDFEQFCDVRGRLVSTQSSIPFDIKRVYWIHADAGAVRGGHSHIVTRQVLIALEGEVVINCRSKLGSFSTLLNNSSKGLLIEPYFWHEMIFEKNSVLLAIASHIYEANDYVTE